MADKKAAPAKETQMSSERAKRQAVNATAAGDSATEDERTIDGWTYSRKNPMGVREEGTAGPDVPENLVQGIVARVKADGGQRKLSEEDIAIATRKEWRQGLTEGKLIAAVKAHLGIG